MKQHSIDHTQQGALQTNHADQARCRGKQTYKPPRLKPGHLDFDDPLSYPTGAFTRVLVPQIARCTLKTTLPQTQGVS